MSTIIERAIRTGSVVTLVLAGWGSVLLAMPFIGAGRQVAIVGKPEILIPKVAAAGGQLVDVRGGVVLARSDRPNFASELYHQGVTLVLEGRIAGGCIRI